MTAKPLAQRLAQHKAARQAQGLKRIELWAHPEDVPAIKQHAAELAQQRKEKQR